MERLQRAQREAQLTPGLKPGPLATLLPDAAVQAWAGGIAAKVPMGRFGQPSEVAKVVLFLASDDSSYMLGENLLVDGGMAPVRELAPRRSTTIRPWIKWMQS